MAPDFLRWPRPRRPPPAPPDPGRRLLTLIHLSDLHFGYPSAEDGAPPPADWRRHVKLLDGFLGHHFAALDHLTHTVNLLRAREGEPAPVLVVTGDLTACGRSEEFERATRFLETAHDVGGPIHGLKDPGALDRAIPGNHDHWPGTGQVKGDRVAAFDRTFGSFPKRLFERALPGGPVVQVFGINSDADVDPNGRQRRFARGSFAKQIAALDNDPSIAQPTGQEIRVLLVHHSPAHGGYLLGMDGPSRRGLDAWIRKAGISVMLTGHLHDARGRVDRVSDRGSSWNLLEARCGTSTQIDRMPAAWAAKRTFRSNRLPINSLLVHRLIQRGEEIHWEVEFLERLHDGFKQRRALPGLPTRPIVVWPR